MIDGRFHAALLGRQDDLRPIGAHRRPALHAHVLRHDEDHAVTLDGRRHGQGDTGIAAGGLDQGIAGFDLTPHLGVANHAQGRPVLDRTGRIVTLQLDQQGIGGGAGQALQPYQRRVPDKVFYGGKFHGWGSGSRVGYI